jgi:hypothetical protein
MAQYCGERVVVLEQVRFDDPRSLVIGTVLPTGGSRETNDPLPAH